MGEPCEYGAVYAVDKKDPRKGSALLRKCWTTCEPGEKLCPRHKYLAQVKAAEKAAKEVAKKAEAKAKLDKLRGGVR